MLSAGPPCQAGVASSRAADSKTPLPTTGWRPPSRTPEITVAVGEGLAFHGTSVWRVLLEGIVNSVVVVVIHILANQPPEMFFMQRYDMVQDFPTATSNPAFGDSILPRRSHSSLRPQARCIQKTDHCSVKIWNRGPGCWRRRGRVPFWRAGGDHSANGE
jgi:hypothetical protein